jgi:hypothetical protein
MPKIDTLRFEKISYSANSTAQCNQDLRQGTRERAAFIRNVKH